MLRSKESCSWFGLTFRVSSWQPGGVCTYDGLPDRLGAETASHWYEKPGGIWFGFLQGEHGWYHDAEVLYDFVLDIHWYLHVSSPCHVWPVLGAATFWPLQDLNSPKSYWWMLNALMGGFATMVTGWTWQESLSAVVLRSTSGMQTAVLLHAEPP